MMDSDNIYEAESELECLIQAVQNILEAKKRRAEAYEEYQGCSPEYHLASYNDAVSDACAEFGNYLGKVIDRRVQAILNKKV